MLSEQRDDLGEDGFAHQLSFMVFRHDAWTHLDLLTHLEVTQRNTGNLDKCATEVVDDGSNALLITLSQSY